MIFLFPFLSIFILRLQIYWYQAYCALRLPDCYIDFDGTIFLLLDIINCGVDDGCHENATCSDANGNYTCDCKTGFTGDGFNCSGKFLILHKSRTRFCIFVVLYWVLRIQLQLSACTDMQAKYTFTSSNINTFLFNQVQKINLYTYLSYFSGYSLKVLWFWLI